MQTVIVILNLFMVLRLVTSGVMCVFGYKWSKGLIAIMSSYVGIGMGGFITYLLLQNGMGLECIVVVPISAVLFSVLAYKWIALNHFMAGFLLSIKILFMIAVNMSENMSSDSSGMLFCFIVVLSIIIGIVVCNKYNHYILIACVSYLGAIELTTKIFDWINKGLFLSTGDISFIFNPVEFILSLLGIEIPSGGETIVIILIGLVSFWYQRSRVVSLGIDLSDKIVDDRNL